ncbi:deoxyribonuclease, TatD-related [Helicobacter mustelae]|uniref:TatD family hydrolase n=1 Tax=Helicobacter mustelae TaxID=217 RepID=UPI000DFE8491|nr:TatD family hydrolase [Helicobacter mustelae]STP13052.1 deoxyribonuclease, TatD-related [Helicobacter mustelae]
MFVDTHCHLNDVCFVPDVDEVIARARSKGVERFLIPGANPLELPQALALSERYDCVFFAVGIHPYDINKGELGDLIGYAKHPKCLAIGECGLDYFRVPEEGVEAYKNAQKELFCAHIKLALELDKPLILHVREASEDVYEILREYEDARGVLHCYNADEILLNLSKNFYYGIGGICTFGNAKKITAVLPKIPEDRILLETDAPYLAPVPFRGKRNEPSLIPIIAQKIAEVRGICLAELEQISTQNAQRIFGLGS